jgi:hypothetical protein
MPVCFPNKWPEHLDRNNPRYCAEAIVYDWFQELPNDWTVYHDIHNERFWAAQGSPGFRKTESQVDFIVVAPGLAIFILEVKGGGISVEGSQWYSTGGDRVQHKIQDPFMQAKDNKWSLINYLRNREKGHDIKTGCANRLFVHGVIFPHTIPSEGHFEGFQYKLYQVLTLQGYKALKNARIPLENWFENFAKEYRSRHQSTSIKPRKGPTFEHATFIKDTLLPRVQSLNILPHIENLGTSIENATLEQARFFQFLPSPRLVVQGPAGSGKTVLAFQEAVNAVVNSNQTVLLLCFNKNLNEYLEYCKDATDLAGQGENKEKLNNRLSIKTIHGLLCEFSGQDLGQGFDEEYLYVTLPEQVKNHLVANNGIEKYDLIIIDEGQDLLHPGILEVINLLLKGGLRNGRWRLYLDLLQSLYAGDNFSERLSQIRSQFLFKNDVANFTFVHLKQVVRYGYGTCRFLENRFKLTQKLMLPSFSTTPLPQVIKSHSGAESVSRLIDLLDILETEQVPGSEIVILSPLNPTNNPNSILYQLFKNKKNVLGDYTLSSEKTLQNVQDDLVYVTTIHSFKGLESSIVIVVDITNQLGTELMYTAMTRARYETYLLVKDNSSISVDLELDRKFFELIELLTGEKDEQSFND